MRWRVPLATLAVAGIALAAAAAFGPRSDGTARRPAAALPTSALEGRPVSLRDLRGHSSLIVFWASWCGPCRKEAPALARFAAGPDGRGRVVAVAWDDDPRAARRFADRYGWRFPVLHDAHGAVGDRYRLDGLPTTFVLDRDGRIVQRLRGPQSEASLAGALEDASRA